MKKVIYIILAVLVILILYSCSGTAISDSAEVRSVKNGHLTQYSTTVTVGEAIDGFLGDPTWEYFESTDGEKVVQCTGNCTYNDKEVEAQIQFLLNEDDTFQAYALSLNGIDQNNLMMLGFLSKVYEDTIDGESDDAPYNTDLNDDDVDGESDNAPYNTDINDDDVDGESDDAPYNTDINDDDVDGESDDAPYNMNNQ